MAWTTKKGFNFRYTLAYVTDNAGEIAVIADTNSLRSYPQSLTLDSDTFNVGWTVGGGNDGGRDRSTSSPSSSDHRTAGVQANTSANAVYTWRIDAGTAAGQYKLWMALCDIGNGTGGTVTFAVRDSNGTLVSQSALAALTSNQVYDINGVKYSTAAAWAAAADGAGTAITVNTTDTGNGNGGPIFYIDIGTASALAPLSHFAVQYLSGGGAPANQYPRAHAQRNRRSSGRYM